MGKTAKLFLAFVVLAVVAGAATFAVKTLPASEDFVEPSTQNEVDHAIDLGEAWLERVGDTNAPDAALAFAWTNGASRAAVARKLVALQRGDGRWEGTNATATAVEILKGL